ncbi:hypothetical protein KM1_297090 [Entamoeba histolytica HM-3:IMSS]|uniref:Uncharacterized protein n=2 Tax=Entamoeba histolytica TaxID=5759 RepID=N9UYT5_ENTH1|nr:hypothetical protein KM1_297090 [Entamoeba histolytica HM-3:IMSS]ENY61983.1 hypothetical protein EHI7A_194510 [Entamoeba histolytica HM-1:IMSS-A]
MKTYPFTIPDNLQRYSYAIRDSTDFDHIQFGYFFTVNGIDVVDKLTIDKAIQQKSGTTWNGYSLHHSYNKWNGTF